MNALVRRLLLPGAGAVLLVVAGVPAGAQSAADASAQPQHTLQMVPAVASLDHTLDAKKAKPGEPVTAKLQKDVHVPQQEDLPKNTELEGHVDQVVPSEHKSDSTVVVTFDKAKLKSGKELPIKATILAISEPAYLAQQQTTEQPVSGGMPSGGPQTGGAAPNGAGSAPAPRPMQTAPEPSMTGQQPQRNGVPGVMLQSSIHQATSATFTSKGKNVHIPDGTQLEVALVVVPAGTRIQ
jgi:hypothetical protein